MEVTAAPAAPAAAERRAILRECAMLFAVATALTAALWRLAGVVGFVDEDLPALVAVVFLYLPAWAAWRRGEDLPRWGFGYRPLGRTLAFGVAAPLFVFPLFAIGFVIFFAMFWRLL
jgi:hypothetical protein